MNKITSSMPHSKKGAVLLGAFLTGFLLLYIFQINALTASIYHLGDQEKRLDQLKEQTVYLQAQHLPSFTRIRMEKLAQEMQFVRVQEISYLKVLGSSVATIVNQE